MKHYGYESTENEHPHKKLLIVQQILLVSPWEMYGEQGKNTHTDGMVYGVKRNIVIWK